VNAQQGTRKSWLRIALFAFGGFILALGCIAAYLAVRFQPVARDYFISTLKKRYQSDVALGNLQISLLPEVHATGENLVFWLHGDHSGQPMVQIRRFTLEAGFVNFFRNPKHINKLRLEGLQIHLPPHNASEDSHPQANSAPQSNEPGKSPASAFILDEVIADGTTLETAPKDPTKAPLRFDIEKLTLRTVGVGQPMTFEAALTNPKPPGLIHSEGNFGPWNALQPSETPVLGKYTFRDADLSIFKGIAGILSSDGQYKGELDRIEVQGVTDTPDFSLKIGGHPMALHTEFQATVDGTNGNTVLHPVHARLGRSEFDVSGAIDRAALETHKTILLEAKAGGKSRLEDFLRLSVQSPKPPMNGNIRFDTKVKIPPGETDVISRLQLDGSFGLSGVTFSSADVQGKITSLSHRAQGDPKNHDPDVTADFDGHFHLRSGQLNVPDLHFSLPGANVNLAGSYMLPTGAIDFKGQAKLDATVSQMTTGFKSILLKPIDPLFRRDGAGTLVPIEIGGTRGQPSFKINIGEMLRRK
jgi:hypothetical protein